MSSGIKTSITEVTVANEQLYKLVAYKCDTSPKQVEECIDILGKFIKSTMEEGAFDGIMIPYFGKIRVKAKRAQWMNHSKVMPHLPTHIQPKQHTDGTL
jgi:nucleoid DNA-binding protein